MPRTESLRILFERGFSGILTGISSAFSDVENVSRMLGLEEAEPNELFLEHTRETITQFFKSHKIDAPLEFVERLIFAAAQENLPVVFEQHRPRIQSILSRLLGEVGQRARDSHNKALGMALVPERRQQDLRPFNWSIANGPAGDALLPDCVALASTSNASFTPYVMAGRDDATAVVMALDSKRFLVGVRRGESPPDLRNYNEYAAACSSSFVVSSSKPSDAVRLVGLIGSLSTQVLDGLMSSTINEKFAPKPVNVSAVEAQSIHQHRTPDSAPLSYSIDFLGCADQSTAEKISNVVRYVVEKYNQLSTLGRLDGVTFAADCSAALRDLDRGFDVDEPARITTQGEVRARNAQAPLVVRDGIIKTRIVMHAEYAYALISENSDVWQFALHAFVFELAETAFVEQLDTAFPGFIFSTIASEHDRILYQGVNSAITGYFAARGSAGFGADEIHEQILRSGLTEALSRARHKIEAAKIDYSRTQNVDAVFNAGLDVAAEILAICAGLVGHRGGLELPLFDQKDALEEVLKAHGLGSWLGIFGRDLHILWARKGKWDSIEEFLVLKRHTERLLWQFGIFAWKLQDGRTYVRFSR